MIWTAVSYNWSAGLTGLYVFHGSHSHAEASKEFLDQYPGENLLGLVAGDHGSSSTTYPLLTPGAPKLRREEKDADIQ